MLKLKIYKLLTLFGVMTRQGSCRGLCSWWNRCYKWRGPLAGIRKLRIHCRRAKPFPVVFIEFNPCPLQLFSIGEHLPDTQGEERIRARYGMSLFG
jgi:hypothetical protein